MPKNLGKDRCGCPIASSGERDGEMLTDKGLTTPAAALGVKEAELIKESDESSVAARALARRALRELENQRNVSEIKLDAISVEPDKKSSSHNSAAQRSGSTQWSW